MEIMLTKEELAKEVWVDFEGHDMNYKISNMGRVMSYLGTVQRLMKIQKNQYGEAQVMLTGRDRETAHNMMVGKEVAKRFVPNPDGYHFIRYKDGNNLNCKASNIEWVKHTDKMKKQYRSFLKEVNQYDENGHYIKTFSSAAEAAEALGVEREKIAAYCNGNVRPFNGFLFRYNADFPAGQDITPKKPAVVYQFEKNGTLVRKYSSAKAAEAARGKAHLAGNISRCIRGERASAGGYVWRFSEDFYKIG